MRRVPLVPEAATGQLLEWTEQEGVHVLPLLLVRLELPDGLHLLLVLLLLLAAPVFPAALGVLAPHGPPGAAITW